jgi:hypothetical protein
MGVYALAAKYAIRINDVEDLLRVGPISATPPVGAAQFRTC